MFKFLLQKGVSVLASNQDLKTTIHFAIELQRIEFLYYLFEGKYLESAEIAAESCDARVFAQDNSDY